MKKISNRSNKIMTGEGNRW